MSAPPLTDRSGITSKLSIYGYDPIQRYSVIDYLNKAMPIFNKLSFYHLPKLSPWQKVRIDVFFLGGLEVKTIIQFKRHMTSTDILSIIIGKFSYK